MLRKSGTADAVDDALAEIHATMSFYERVMVAKHCIEKAWLMPRLVPRVKSTDPDDQIRAIQSMLRSFLERKHDALPVPNDFKCMVFTHKLFVTPVVAADGYTYEYESIKRFFADFPLCPFEGPNRIQIKSKILVHNYNLRSALAEFRDTHLMSIPRLVVIPCSTCSTSGAVAKCSSVYEGKP